VSEVLGMHLSRGILMHQHRLRRHLVGMLLLLRRMRGVGRLMDLVHGRIMGITIHRLRELRRLLAIQTSSMLVVRLRRGHGCWRVGLWRVVNGGIRRPLHVGGCCHRIWCLCVPVSEESHPTRQPGWFPARSHGRVSVARRSALTRGRVVTGRAMRAARARVGGVVGRVLGRWPVRLLMRDK
jgi:hypothetical protein